MNDALDENVFARNPIENEVRPGGETADALPINWIERPHLGGVTQFLSAIQKSVNQPKRRAWKIPCDPIADVEEVEFRLSREPEPLQSSASP